KRDIELKGREHLVKVLLGDVTVCYDDKGKPHLTDRSKHISISHSHDKLAIIANAKEATGIDIELIRDKVLRIRHKYLSENELQDTGSDIEKLLIYWAAKETLYKIYGLKEVDFIANLFISPFPKQKLGTIIGKIMMPDFNEEFELNYEISDN